MLILRYPSHPTSATYTNKVLSYLPYAYWPLAETSGTTITDASGNGYVGTYNGPTLNQSGIGDGKGAPLFDGVNDYGNVQSAGLVSAFNGSEGSLLCWMAAANWSGGTTRYVLRFASDGSNEVAIWQSSTAGRILFDYRAGGTLRQVQRNGVSDTGWIPCVMTWSATNGIFNVWMYGTQVGSNQVSLGTWSGTGSAIRQVLGAQTATPGNPYSGRLAHVALWNAPLGSTAIADLATV